MLSLWPAAPRQEREDDPDAAVLAAAGRGEPRACAQLVDRHLGRVHRLATRLLDDPAEAEDVAQELFLRLWQAAPNWRRGEARVSTWIHTVTLNLCRDRLRRRRPQLRIDETVEHLLPADESAQPEHRLQSDQREEQLRAAIQALPERQREALLLFHFEGLDQAECAAALDVSVDALESLLARARRALKQRCSAPQGGAP
jgi:RNA polymerase sigma-70 factor (ECF subfamily)